MDIETTSCAYWDIIGIERQFFSVVIRNNELFQKKGKRKTVFILFKYILQLTIYIYILHILVDGDLLNSVLLI